MRHALLFSMIASAAVSTVTNANDAASVGLPDWMSGHWCREQGEEHVEEFWLSPAGGLMLGMSRTVAPAARTQFEFLRIELVEGVPTYLAQPEGGAATAFKRTHGGADWVRFENPAHDFPQRIEYRRNGDSMHAEISGPGEEGAEFSIPFEFNRCRN